MGRDSAGEEVSPAEVAEKLAGVELPEAWISGRPPESHSERLVNLLEPIALPPHDLTPEEIEARRHTDGASEAFIRHGLGGWTAPDKNPLTALQNLYREKRGEYVRVFTEAEMEPMRRGQCLEFGVAHLLAVKHGWKLHRAPRNVAHPKYEFLTASVDFVVEEKSARFSPLQIKTSRSPKGYGPNRHDVKASHKLQVLQELAVYDMPHAFVGVLLRGAEDCFEVERDLDIERRIIDCAEDFRLGHVEKGVMPDESFLRRHRIPGMEE
jgi:predicted phage-related endonuclease